MADPNTNPGAESEMTPEAAAVIARAKRSFAFSIGLLLLGFIAIVAALVYRATRDSEPPADVATLGQIIVPAGAEVVSVAPGAGELAVTFRHGDDTMVRLIDKATGAVIRDIPVVRVAQ